MMTDVCRLADVLDHLYVKTIVLNDIIAKITYGHQEARVGETQPRYLDCSAEVSIPVFHFGSWCLPSGERAEVCK